MQPQQSVQVVMHSNPIKNGRKDQQWQNAFFLTKQACFIHHLSSKAGQKLQHYLLPCQLGTLLPYKSSHAQDGLEMNITNNKANLDLQDLATQARLLFDSNFVP